MAMTDAEVKELKAMLGAARQHVLNFGLCLGKTPQDTVLMMSRNKDGKSLASKAKSSAKGTAVCHGTCKIEGGALMLDCDVATPSGMLKGILAAFKALSISTSVKIAKESQAKAEEGPHPDTAKWQKAQEDFALLLDGSLSRLPEGGSLRAAWEYALSAAEDGDIDKAMTSLAKVKDGLDKALKDHGKRQTEAFLKSFDEVKAGLTDDDRTTLRQKLTVAMKGIGTLSAVDLEGNFKTLAGELAKMVKATKEPLSGQVATEKKELTEGLQKLQNQIDGLEKEVAKLVSRRDQTEKDISEIKKKLNGSQRPKKAEAERLEKRLETLGEALESQKTAVDDKVKEIAPLVTALKKSQSQMTELSNSRLANMETRLKNLTREVPESAFKAIHDEIGKTIKGMAEAMEWREGKDGEGGEVRRNVQDGSHGSVRHGAQSGIERQARRSATGGAAPDSATNPTGVTHQITSWKGADIEWEVVMGKRKIKNRTPVQKQIVAEVANMTNLPADGSSSIFANPVLEKLAVDSAIKKMAAKGWNQIYSNAQGWHDLTSVTLHLGPPKTYGSGYPGWGYSVSRKEAAVMAVSDANKVLDDFEKGTIDEKEMLKRLGVEYLMKDGVVAMVPYVRVVLSRDNGSAKWKSITHFPDKTKTAQSWDIEGRRVRKTNGPEEQAAF